MWRHIRLSPSTAVAAANPTARRVASVMANSPAAQYHRRAQPEVDSSFDEPGAQRSGGKVGADAKRFQFRTNRGARDAAIQASDHAHRGVGKRRYDPSQVVAIDPDIAIVHQQNF